MIYEVLVALLPRWGILYQIPLLKKVNLLAVSNNLIIGEQIQVEFLPTRFGLLDVLLSYDQALLDFWIEAFL